MAKKTAETTTKKQINVLLGVSGGVAAYKSVDIASRLNAAGFAVDVIMTENAQRFVGVKSFEAVTGRYVFTTMWQNPGGTDIQHVSLADKCDIVVIAPATANIIAKAANGICDDLLSTTICVCWQKKVLLAPAMNEKMWHNPVVQWNIRQLAEMGFETIGPRKGKLACGKIGEGRMSEPQDIVERIEKIAREI